MFSSTRPMKKTLKRMPLKTKRIKLQAGSWTIALALLAEAMKDARDESYNSRLVLITVEVHW